MFTTREIESPGPGKILKETRRLQGLSLQECSKKLKIQKKYLEWLESEEYEKLPADIYTKNFLKRYASFLNLDLDGLLSYYKKGAIIQQNLNSQKKAYLKARRLVITPKKISTVILLAFFILIIGYLFFQVKNFFIGPKIILDYPAQDTATSSEKIEIAGHVDPNTYLTVNGQPVNFQKDGYFVEEIVLRSGLNTITIEASNRFGKKSTFIRQIIKETEGQTNL